MAKKKNIVGKAADSEPKESLFKAFFKGFALPIKFIIRGLGWIAHKPPLKQIGHGLRWFFLTPPLRFIGRIIGLGYIRNSFRELKLVTWPSWAESRRLTGAVILFSVVFGAFITALDYGLDKLFKHVLLK